MPIASADITYWLSGGIANTDPDASLGGARSTDPGGEITSAVLNNVFDDVSGDEGAAGDVEYRCVYALNEHGTLTLQGPVLWIGAETPSGDSAVDIGLDPAGVNGTATTVGDESTAPAGVTFSHPTTKGTGISIGDIPAGQHQAIWIRRTIGAAAAAFNNDGPTIRVEGDTAA